MQVNSLGLTELQPENNVYRILIQMLPVVIAKNSRARAVQLPAWNEALGLPRPWDQQWSLRLQQIMAYETDLLEFDDVFEGSKVLKNKVKTLKEFKNRIKEEAEKSFEVESDRMLKNDVVLYLVDKIKFDLPDEFLMRWLVKSSEKPLTLDQVKVDYPQYSKSLKWQLIENKILEDNNVKINNEDLIGFTKKLVKRQMQQYGQTQTDDKQLSDIAENILKNEEERKKISNQLFDEKTLLIYKDLFKLNQKSISYDDFVKLATEK